MELIIYFFIYLVEGFIFFHYTSNLFKNKYSHADTILFTLLGHGLMYVISFVHNAYINTLSFALISLLLLYYLYTIRFSHAIFHTTILTTIMLITETFTASILSNYLADIWLNWSHASVLIFLAIFSKLLYFIVVQVFIILHRKRNSKTSTSDFGTYSIILLSLCIMAFPLILCILGWTLPNSTALEKTIATSSILMCIILVLVYILYGYNQKKGEAYLQLQLQLQKERDAKKYYNMLAQQDERQKIMIHDIKKHLQSLAQLNQDGNQRRIEQYLNELLQSDSLKMSARVCNHELLNAILCRYQIQCQEKGINFYSDIRNGLVDFLNDEEITALFCNLLDNAIEAVGNTPDEFIEICLIKKATQPFITLVVKNSCPQAPKKELSGHFLSSKPYSVYHGYGLRSVDRIVSKHAGHMQAYYEESDSTFHVIICFPTS